MRTKIAPLQSDGGAGLQQSMGTLCHYKAGLSARHSAQGTLDSYICLQSVTLVSWAPPGLDVHMSRAHS